LLTGSVGMKFLLSAWGLVGQARADGWNLIADRLGAIAVSGGRARPPSKRAALGAAP
jgi:hypothetical protein